MTEPAARSLVGIVPAAGRGARLGRLPFCKELYPLGHRAATGRAVVVIEDVLERMKLAGVARAFIVIGRDKAPLVDYLGDGAELGIELAYVIQDQPRGMPFALDLPRPWLRGETVVFGMPDTIVRPRASFRRLLAVHERTAADVTLGVFPTAEPHRFGMVGLGDGDRVVASIDKPAATELRYLWGIASWGPAFAALMADYLRGHAASASEVVLSAVFQRAIDEGLRVMAARFDDGEYVDIGTPESVRRLDRFIDD